MDLNSLKSVMDLMFLGGVILLFWCPFFKSSITKCLRRLRFTRISDFFLFFFLFFFLLWTKIARMTLLNRVTENKAGALPWRHLKTRVRTLNWIRALIGSQWRLRGIGVTFSNFLLCVTSLAAEFCTRWSKIRWAAGAPRSRPLL